MTQTVYGDGDYRFAVVPDWGRGPDGVSEFGLVSMLACDDVDRVYVFQREPDPMVMVFTPEGRLERTWGQDFFQHPHGIWIGPDQTVYCTDRDRQVVTQWTREGELLRTWGRLDQAGAPGQPFNEPTRAIIAPTGDCYVSDGYGQYRVHRFAADGTLLHSWGEQGTGPGQFGWPVHSVAWHPAGKVLIVDRENNRIQHFTPEGEYLEEWGGFAMPQDLFIDPGGLIYIAEGEQRISLLDLDGTVISRWGELGDAPGQFRAMPHACWVDRQGSLYVSEVTTYNCLQKFVRV